MANTIVIKKGTEKEKFEDKLKVLEAENKFPASKFCGKVKVKEDPVEIQKRLRNEWR